MVEMNYSRCYFTQDMKCLPSRIVPEQGRSVVDMGHSTPAVRRKCYHPLPVMVHSNGSSFLRALLPNNLLDILLKTSDTPFDLALAALESIPVLTNTQNKTDGFAFTIYTGDLVSHDPNQQLGQAIVEYTEVSGAPGAKVCSSSEFGCCRLSSTIFSARHSIAGRPIVFHNVSFH